MLAALMRTRAFPRRTDIQQNIPLCHSTPLGLCKHRGDSLDIQQQLLQVARRLVILRLGATQLAIFDQKLTQGTFGLDVGITVTVRSQPEALGH